MIYGKAARDQEEESWEHPCIIIITSKKTENMMFMKNLVHFFKFSPNNLYKSESLNIYSNPSLSTTFSKLYHITETNALMRYANIINSHSPQSGYLLCFLLDENLEYQKKKFFNFETKFNKHLRTIFLTSSDEIYLKELQKMNFEIKLIDLQNIPSIKKILIDAINEKNTNEISQDSFLLKKRKPIFQIFKIPKSKKKLKKPSFTLSNDLSLAGEDSINEDINKNNDNENENHSTFNDDSEYVSRNSLISISKEVFRYIRQKIQTKGSDVTNHILCLLTTKGNKLNYKNIQRRVYDAINVMSAIGIISKDKGVITYLQNKPISFNSSPIDMEEKKQSIFTNLEIDEEIEKLNNSIKSKQNILIQQCTQTVFYSKFIQMNQTDIKRNSTVDKLDFPFYILALNNDSKYSIKQVDFNNRVVILSNQPFRIIDPENLIKFFVKNDFSRENVRKYFSSDLANYLLEKKIIDNYLKNTCSDFDSYNNSNPTFREAKNGFSYSFNQKLFEPISILDSDYNKFGSIDIRKGSEDLSNFNCYPSSFNFPRGEDPYDIIENPEKAYSNHLSPYFYSKH